MKLVLVLLFIYLFIYFSEQVDKNKNDEKHNKPETTQMAKITINKFPLKLK